MEMKRLNGITAIVPLRGNISAELEETLKAEYTEAEREGLQNIILDFRPVNHIDIEGISALVKLSVTAERLRLVSCVYGLSDDYRKLFQLCGISERYPDYESIRRSIIMLSEPENRSLEKTDEPAGSQDTTGWAELIDKIELTELPKGALARNMHGRRVLGPLQGFGYLWLKTYLLDVQQPGIAASEVMSELKAHFTEFQPKYNKFYPTSKGIQAGENVLIDSKTPGGVVSTGVIVLYADKTSFALMTPAGHPEAGWVYFTSVKKDNSVQVKINGLARASDPFYEFAFRIAGSKFQENIWKHVLSKLAKHLGTEDNIRMTKTIIDKSLHWGLTGNLLYNAQIRSIPLTITRLFSN